MVKDLRPEFRLNADELVDARSAVAEMAVRLDLDKRLEPFARFRWDGTEASPHTLYLDDFSEIPFLDEITAVDEYPHRSRVRSGDGDFFLTLTPAVDGYEEYCRDALAMGSPQGVVTKPVGSSLGIARGCQEGPGFRVIAKAAKAAGGLVIHPYMSVAPVWELASMLADDTGVPISVIGPPPPVTWVANDKMLLTEVVTRVLGPDWLVDTMIANTATELAEHLLSLATRHEFVGIKRLRCASAMGNAVFDSAGLARKSRADVERRVSRFLERTQWDGAEQILAVAWEQTELSPSTQLWIPPPPEPPRLDGIYVQILEGDEKVFVGSRPSALPEPVNRTLGHAALRVAAGLQFLGYVGRCSFDHLVLGDPRGEFRVLFTECNGRWGGTSLPMSLVDRLVPGPRPPYRAQDFVHPDLVGVQFSDLLTRVGDELYDPATGAGHFVFYNVNCLPLVGKIDVIALGETQDEAEAAMMETLPGLLGL